jgi:predicted PurR-regulated permease PerM
MSDPRTPAALRVALTTVGLLVVVVLLWMLREVLLLVGFAALLAFALDPLVSALQRLRAGRGAVSRHFAASLVMLLVAGVLVWALFVVVPQLVRESAGFAERAPAALDGLLASLRRWAGERGLEGLLGPLGGTEPMSGRELLAAGAGPLARAAGRLVDFSQLVGLLLVPVLAFYLLAERAAVESSALQFVPAALRSRAQAALAAVDRALRSYVRGQALVCVVVGGTTGLVLALLGFPGAVLLGTLIAFAEVLPIVGFWSASVAIVLAGWSTADPMRALYGWAAYLIVNQLVGMLVTPRVMGRHMKMHPFVVMVSILAGGSLLGAAGAILALPLAAAAQSLVAEFAPRPRARPAPAPPPASA